ncbi:nucleoside 2-deoxyribosyltransferase [Bacillus suaedaesalsae]|uniref:Nucleoside 2-deoxyribosyltransferase n=1 Tax=Bacillus suaedaesalsae TaxID=2810349 RepID=A0ABS2DGF0_9BACI|nr:nucleoside 2-deoxyribosyltransferase [Bacillus suaedaesalsae]MBM6617554.1 nucleoside 2-deoxyribosyltransferase [Bacillus suaedaesalsae]
MKFYIASGLQNKETVQQVSMVLCEKGHHHTYDWTKNDNADSFEKLSIIGEAEKKGVQEADVLIALLPGGKGTHIEIGIAIGMNKPVYIYTEFRINDPLSSCTFYHIEGVTMISDNINELLIKVEEEVV